MAGVVPVGAGFKPAHRPFAQPVIATSDRQGTCTARRALAAARADARAYPGHRLHPRKYSVAIHKR